MADWMKGAVKHPGAATAAAKAEGLSVPAWAAKHKSDKGVTGQRARLALEFEGMNRPKPKPSVTKAAMS